MSNFISKLTAAGYLVLASVPVAGLAATAAHAAPAAAHVQIGDLDLSSQTGKAAFERRVQVAGRDMCRDEKTLSAQYGCRTGVRAEAQDKLAAVMASRSTTLAAR